MSADDVASGWQKYIKINTELVSFIKQLKKTRRIALCSNAWTEFICPILEENKLSDLFEVIVISSEIGHTKPDKEMYLEAASRLGVKTEDCVFIDDNENNIRGAEAVGMNGYLFTSIEDLKKHLL